MSQYIVKSRGEIEADIRQALIRFEKEFMGRGPLETRTYLVEDMVIVRLERVLNPPELHLAKSEEGCRLLKQVRTKLLEKGRPMLETVIQDIVGIPVQSIHTDISTRTGERIIVFRLKEELPGDLGRQPAARTTLAGRNGSREKERKGVARPS
jgi:uncharacterized protein YbcI